MQSEPPARKVDTREGTLPDAMMLTTSQSVEQMDVGKGIVAASSRCCKPKPEGPAALITMGQFTTKFRDPNVLDNHTDYDMGQFTTKFCDIKILAFESLQRPNDKSYQRTIFSNS